MSGSPSLLKSPVPISVQFGPALGLTGPPPTRVLPLMFQIEAWPLLVFCHRMLLVVVGGGGSEAGVTKPLSVISNNVPMSPPPPQVVPNKLPLASATKVPPGV